MHYYYYFRSGNQGISPSAWQMITTGPDEMDFVQCAILDLARMGGHLLKDFQPDSYVQITLVLNMTSAGAAGEVEQVLVQLYETGDTFQSGLQNLIESNVQTVAAKHFREVQYNVKQKVHCLSLLGLIKILRVFYLVLEWLQ